MTVFLTRNQVAAIKIKFPNGIKRAVWVNDELCDIYNSFKSDENNSLVVKNVIRQPPFLERKKKKQLFVHFHDSLKKTKKLTCATQTSSVHCKI